MNNNQKASSVSKVVDEKGIKNATKAESPKAIYVKVEDPPQVDVPSSPRRWHTELAPLCLGPRGSW